MPNPKKKTSRRVRNNRRSHHRAIIVTPTKCTNCSELVVPHTVCPSCGYYKGKSVIAQ